VTVNEAIEELKAYAKIGYGEKPLLWINLNIQEHVEVETVSPMPDERGIEIR